MCVSSRREDAHSIEYNNDGDGEMGDWYEEKKIFPIKNAPLESLFITKNCQRGEPAIQKNKKTLAFELNLSKRARRTQHNK